MDVNKVFVGGKMDKDSDERYVKNGTYRDATNVRVLTSQGSDVGAMENVQGNAVKSALGLTNTQCLGSLSDEQNEKVYWWITSNEKDGIVEFDKTTEATEFILEGTGLDFTRLRGANLIEGLLFWIDETNQPRKINIETAKTYGLDGFSEFDISVLKSAPNDALAIALLDTGALENNIEEKFLQFSYRFEFLDGEQSALAPFTNVAFFPETDFEFNFVTNELDCMINQFNAVDITFDTGNRTVTDIELVYKESGSDIVYSIETFNKVLLGYSDNAPETFRFDNSKIYQILPEGELTRFFDNVPRQANTQDIIGRELAYANYIEQYDIARANDTKIELDYTVGFNTSVIPTAFLLGDAKASLHSNRDYEIAIAYKDAQGRYTTPLTSKTNTVFIPNTAAVTQNKITVTVNHDVPAFATHFCFFLKQNKVDYETHIPTQLYEDGVFRWLKLENADKEKIKENDLLVIKSDTRQILPKTVYAKVLEVTEQEVNFITNRGLIEDDKVSGEFEEAGLYYKLNPNGFTLNRDDWQTYTSEVTNDENYQPIYSGTAAVTEPTVFYGDGLDDLTPSGSYNETTFDTRFYIEIDVEGTPDTFQWSKDEGQTFEASNIPITGGAQLLDSGVSITFGATTGHTQFDVWVVSEKESWAIDSSKAYGLYPSVATETIQAGARISMIYDETQKETHFNELLTVVASRNYENLEEWWFGDDIEGQWNPLLAAAGNRVRFRRGTIASIPSSGGFDYDGFTQTPSGTMTLIIRTEAFSSGGSHPKVKASITIFQNNNDTIMVFETKPKELDSEIFFEVPTTHAITGGFHTGNVQNQTGGQPAIIELSSFNCFAYGNAIETYKIRDNWNAKSMKIDTRPLLAYNKYKQEHKDASITYSDSFVESTNFNGLNVFNLSKGNWKDLNNDRGSIQKIFFKDDNVLVLQEDKTGVVFYRKTEYLDQGGNPTVVTSNLLLGAYSAYKGDYGISLDNETFVYSGNNAYWVDSKRGAVLRLGQSGIEEISAHGMFDYFKDILRENIFDFKLGVYDQFYNEYIVHIKTLAGFVTISFNEVPRGWTSFFLFEPEHMVRMNNRLYSFKAGELYEHNSEAVPRQQFYGVNNSFNVTLFVNDQPNMDKVFKTFSTQSNAPFDITLLTNLTNGSLASTEFIQRESFFYSDIRQNENAADLTGHDAQGIGTIVSSASTVITFANDASGAVSIGDQLMQVNGGIPEEVGIITGVSGVNISVASLTNAPINTLYAFAKKNSRIEGSEMRGYYLEAKLSSPLNSPVELNGITVNTVLSYV